MVVWNQSQTEQGYDKKGHCSYSTPNRQKSRRICTEYRTHISGRTGVCFETGMKHGSIRLHNSRSSFLKIKQFYYEKALLSIEN